MCSKASSIASVVNQGLTNLTFHYGVVKMSEDNKLFKVAGVSAVKGQYKVRFANDMARVKVLIKTDHTDIELMELPKAMSKGEIATFLKTTVLMDKAVYAHAIEAADAKYNAATVPVMVKVTKATKPVGAKPIKSKKAPSIEDIRARAQANKSSEQAADMLGEAVAALVAESQRNPVAE